MHKIVDFESFWLKSKSKFFTSTEKRIFVENAKQSSIKVGCAKQIEAKLVTSN